MASVTVTAKKPSGPKKPRAHPPYLEMIKEAIMALKERTGSSQYAIAKFIELKQKDLPSNFKKLLLVQLKKLVASGKIVKVKNSFKLAVPAKPVATAAAVKKSPKEAVAAKKVESKPKTGGSTKPKVVVPAKAKKVAAKSKAVAKPKRSAKTVTITSPGKKAATPAKVKKAPVKAAKKPKSIKSPVKKAAAKGGTK